jgi:hypothetical protein
VSRRRSTVSGRRLTVAASLVLAVGLLVPAALARTGPPVPAVAAAAPTEVPDAVGMPATRPSPAPAAPSAAADAAATDTAAGPKQLRARRVVLDDRELADARQVAADFAAAYATFDHKESPEQAAGRLTPWVTPELGGQLAANSGGAAGRAALVKRQQVAEAQVETVTVQRVDRRDVDVLVVVSQKVSWNGGSDTRWPSYLTRVSRGPDGWRVAALQP